MEETTMKAIVCGGRKYYNKSQFRREMDIIHEKTPLTKIIHGGASGADKLAGYWAASIAQIPCEVYEAEWDIYPQGAGPIRNGIMLREEKPDLVIAFPGGKGTADMVGQARKAGVPVIEIAPLDD